MSKNSKPKKKKNPNLREKTKERQKLNEENNDYRRKTINWFPGHMMKAIKEVQNKIQSVDIILEIRDARSPLATGNDKLVEISGNKPRLMVMNKSNLADPKILELWKNWFDKNDEPYIFVNGLEKISLEGVISKARAIVKKLQLQSNPESQVREKLKVMIIGLPNTGKSTIINRLANRDATKVADKPGQTQQQIWISAGKNLDIMDTPGIMPPKIKTQEEGLWLSALNAISERVTDSEDTACYLVNYMLKYYQSNLFEYYKINLDSPELIETLNEIAKVRGFLRAKNQFDYDRTYQAIINDFRKGNLGLISLGHPPLS